MFDVIIAANGKGLRAKTDKLAACLGESTVISRTVNAFRGIDCVNKIIVVTDSDYSVGGAITVRGGATRAESVKNGLAAAESEYVLIHDGARPFVTRDLIIKVMSDTVTYGSSVPFLPVTDSIRALKNGEAVTVDRNDYVVLQTPQGYVRKEIIAAYKDSGDALAYDESELYARRFGSVHLTEGEFSNKKITSPFDVLGYNMRTGAGFDSHRYIDNGKPLTLGGIRVPFDKGVEAHSDGDAVIHAVMDALLSAAGERDIGVLFPDDDPTYENADSAVLLLKVKEILEKRNIEINNVSVTVIAQTPKLKDFIPLMAKRMEEILSLKRGAVSVSATTTEKMGIIGDGKAVACFAVVSVC